jgi:hypothetical protein
VAAPLSTEPREHLCGNRRFVTFTANGAAARSTVQAPTFLAVTHTLLFDHARKSSTKAMLLVSSEASAKSPRRAPGTVRSMFAVAPAARLGRSQVVCSTRLRVPIGTERQAWSTAGPASGSRDNVEILDLDPRLAQTPRPGLAPVVVSAGENASVVWLPVGARRSRSAPIGQDGTLPVEPAPSRGLMAGSSAGRSATDGAARA